MDEPAAVQPVFFYDLGDPACYLVGERIRGELPVIPEWEPVLWSALGVERPQVDRADFEARASMHGLQPVRWPAGWPPDSRTGMLTATYAKHVGRAVAFSLAAFRQVFAGGRVLDQDTALLAAAACEMHPAAVLKGITLRSVARGLDAACARATALRIGALPAIAIGETVFAGPEALEAACAALATRTLTA